MEKNGVDYFLSLESDYYLSAESHYVDPLDGRGKEDAVLFEMGHLKTGIDACVAVPVEVARSFAKKILDTCNKIDENLNKFEEEKNHE